MRDPITKQFEQALQKKKVLILEMKYKRNRLYIVEGMFEDRKYRWTTDGKCFDMRSQPCPDLNVNIEL